MLIRGIRTSSTPQRTGTGHQCYPPIFRQAVNQSTNPNIQQRNGCSRAVCMDWYAIGGGSVEDKLLSRTSVRSLSFHHQPLPIDRCSTFDPPL